MGNHHAVNGKTNYFDWAIFNRYVSNYQRVMGMSRIIWQNAELYRTQAPSGCIFPSDTWVDSCETWVWVKILKKTAMLPTVE